MVKNLPPIQEIQVRSLGWEDPLEKEMATPSSILDWEIPWTEDLGGLQFMGSQRIGHNCTTDTSYSVKNFGSILINVEISHLKMSIFVFSGNTVRYPKLAFCSQKGLMPSSLCLWDKPGWFTAVPTSPLQLCNLLVWLFGHWRHVISPCLIYSLLLALSQKQCFVLFCF